MFWFSWIRNHLFLRKNILNSNERILHVNLFLVLYNFQKEQMGKE